MRALHVTPGYWPATEFGGPIRADRLLVSALADAGVAVEVITTNMRGNRMLPRVPAGDRDVDGVPVTTFASVGSSSWGLSPGLALELGRRVPRCDIVHLQGMWTFPVAAAAAACWRVRRPYVLTPRGCLHPHALGSKRLKKRAHLALLGRWMVQRSAALHFATDQERRAAHPLAQTVPAFVVPNPVEVEPWSTSPTPETEEGKAPRVLILGRISPIKGFDRLLPAMAQLRKAIPDVVLEVVGPDAQGYRRHVEALAREHGVLDLVEFTGLVDEAGRRGALQRAALLVAPSHAESFCMSVAEAMAAGLPVIVSDGVGLSGAVRRARTGEVVKGDPSEFAASMARVLGDARLRWSMGRRGRELVAQELAPAALGAAMAAAYERVLRGTIRSS